MRDSIRESNMGQSKDGFYHELLNVLKQDTRKRFYADNGDLLRNKVAECAMNLDNELIKLLLSNERVKNRFFTKVNDLLVFDKMAFVWAINNKAFLKDSYTRFKNNIGLVDSNEQFISSKNDVVLSFPYKDCILEGGQTKEDQKREEIYYNELLAPDDIDRLLAPKVFTNAKRYTKNGEENITEFDDEDNLLIKGNNLLALSSILKKYEGKVKCIYIDPPYNTGNDSFKYNDNFNHSTWLTFMRNRLVLAKRLLDDDGAIFVSINNIELGYLLVLMDELFGQENKLPIVTLRAGTTASYRSINECPVNVTEYVVGYKKEKYVPNKLYRQSEYSEDYSHYIMNINDSPANWILKSIADIVHEKNNCKNWQEFKKKHGNTWKKIRHEQMAKFANDNKDKVVSLNTLQKPSKYVKEIIDKSKETRNTVFEIKRENLSPIYCYNGRTLAFYNSKYREINGDFVPTEILTNLWSDISFLGIGPEGGVTLENGKKPEYLLKTILELSTQKGDLVLDYHIGSGTTLAVAHKLERKYIGIEQLNYDKNDSTIRLQNVIKGDKSGISQYPEVNWQGGGSFVYCELKELNQKFVNEIKVANDKKLNELYNTIISSEFISYKVDIDKLKDGKQEFENLSIDDKKKFLIEILDKNMLYVNYCDIDDNDFEITEQEKAFTKSFYGDK